MCDIHNHIPQRPPWQLIGVLLSVGIVPMELLVRIAVAAPFMVMVSGSFHPFFVKVGWFVLVSAVGITMGVIVTMFGAVVSNLKPVVPFAVFVFDPLI